YRSRSPHPPRPTPLPRGGAGPPRGAASGTWPASSTTRSSGSSPAHDGWTRPRGRRSSRRRGPASSPSTSRPCSRGRCGNGERGLGQLPRRAPKEGEADERVREHEAQVGGEAVGEKVRIGRVAAEKVDPQELTRAEMGSRDRERGAEEDEREEREQDRVGHVDAEERQ